MVVGGHKLELIPAHYLHASANFHVYDPEAKVFFSGDVGAALLPPGHSIWVGGHQGAESARAFDEHIQQARVFPSAMDAFQRRQKRLDRTVFASWTSTTFVLSTERFMQAKTWHVSWTGSTA